MTLLDAGATLNESMNPAPLKILAYEPSPLGTLCLRQRELLSEPGTIVTEITLDGEFLMSSYNTASERALARSALGMHGGDGLNVLVGGLGLGYTAREALASERVSVVEAVEFLPTVIAWFDKGLVPLAGELKADSRFRVTQGDVYARLAAPPGEPHDVILIDVDHSPEERLGKAGDSFYTEAGLKAGKRHLKPGGVLGVWSYAESSPFAGSLRKVFGEVRVEKVIFENRSSGREETNWLFFAGG